MNKKRVVVAHPFRQHSFKIARALNDEGMLVGYCTTVYNKKKSLMGFMKLFLKGENIKKAERRKCEGISEDNVVLFCELRGYFALFLNRFCKKQNIVNAYRNYLYKAFGKKVARYAINNKVDTVIMFDTTAAECFKIIKKMAPQIELVLDMSAASILYCKKIYEDEALKTGITYYKETQAYLWNEKLIKYVTSEFKYADKFLAASEFTRRSLLYSNVDNKKIFILPYGINVPIIESENNKKNNSVFKLLFVGHVDYRKGIHHLINVIGRLDSSQFELHIYGVYHTDSTLYQEIKRHPNVYLHGFVTPDKLQDIYRTADLFVFPSTNDGYGMVVLEALSYGLPVLCSNNAGASDAILDGINGYTFEFDDEKKLEELITYCEKNRDVLGKMSLHTNDVLRDITWDNYNKNLISIINA